MAPAGPATISGRYLVHVISFVADFGGGVRPYLASNHIHGTTPALLAMRAPVPPDRSGVGPGQVIGGILPQRLNSLYSVTFGHGIELNSHMRDRCSDMSHARLYRVY
jgi:hypothetical protein